MRPVPLRSVASLCVLACALAASAQAPPRLDVLKSTPEGSWQLREQITTRENGEQRILLIRTSRLGEEVRGGEQYIWLEMELKPTKIDKKGRPKEEPVVYTKMLLKKWILEGDTANAIQNPLMIAQEVIFQIGEEGTPTRFMGKSLEKVSGLLGTQIRYVWEPAGEESVTIGAGTFDTVRFHGQGSAATKVLLKKLKIDAEGDFYYAANVPFGLVKSTGQHTISGKTETWTSELKEFAVEGAVSMITKEVADAQGSKLVKIFGE